MLYTPFHSLKELQYRFLPIHISLSVWDWRCSQEFSVPNQNLFLLNGWEFRDGSSHQVIEAVNTPQKVRKCNLSWRSWWKDLEIWRKWPEIPWNTCTYLFTSATQLSRCLGLGQPDLLAPWDLQEAQRSLNVRHCNMFSRRVRTTSDIKKG